MPIAAVLVAIVAYALLPENLLFAPRYVIAGVEVVLLVTLVATNPRRLVRRARLSRIASTLLAGTVIVTNLVALGMLVHSLTQPATSGGSLLLGRDAGVADQRDRVRAAVLGARPRRAGRPATAAARRAAAGGLALLPGRER